MSVSDGTVIRIVASLLFPDSVIAQNVFHLVATDLSGDDDEAAVVIDMEEYTGKLFADIEAFFADSISAGELKVYEYDEGDDDFDEVGTGVTDCTPSSGVEMLPHGVALVQNFFTVDPDVQGRKFWGGMSENVSDDGIWSAAVLAAFALSAADLITTFNAPTSANVYQPVVWSPTNLLPYYYSGVVATKAVPGYQRRRKPGVGI